MSKFYTRSGDDGYTGLLGEGRIPKDHPLTDTIGTIDEASAALGIARSTCQAAQTGPVLLAVQRDLYQLMAEIAATPENAWRFRSIDAARVAWLEEQTDILSNIVSLPKEFILPGDSQAGAALALARTIVRRAERRVVALSRVSEIQNQDLIPFLNRLSSLCFVLELLENQAAGSSTPTLAKKQGIDPA